MSSENSPTRDRILKAAATLLENEGAARTRMSDIAKAARISRQALYLHFPNRAELLVATVRHVDKVKNVDARLAASRSAGSGAQRLAAWVDAWGGYIPEIYAVAKALIAMQDSDAEAKAAWEDRMTAVRHGCAAVIEALSNDNALTAELTEKEATDLLTALVSVQSWEALCLKGEWTQARYIAVMQGTVARALLRV